LLSAPIILNIIVFATYIKTSGEDLDAATAFTTVALFGILRFPFAFMPMGLLQYIQSKIALNRILNYLLLPDLPSYVKIGADAETRPWIEGEGGFELVEDGKEYEVLIRESSFRWVSGERKAAAEKGKGEEKKAGDAAVTPAGDGDDRPDRDVAVAGFEDVTLEDVEISDVATSAPKDYTILHDINLNIEKGKLYGVVGAVGSGKSSLLQAILGEMDPVTSASAVSMPGKNSGNSVGYAAYCAQTPWVVNDTLRGNVLFGRPFDEDRYQQTLTACALADDIAVLPAGDLTEIGEKGINLSGGQKARVSLARALYHPDSQLMLLDDPLSAVDSHVGEHLFDSAIAGSICAGKTRLLVTHHVHFLPRCDAVVVMEEGRVKHFGTYDELVGSGVDFAGAVKFEEAEEPGGNRERASSVSSVESAESDRGDKGGSFGGEDPEKKADGTFTSKEKTEGANMTTKEERSEGAVSAEAYWRYARSGGIWLAIGTFGTQAVARATELGGMFWLAKWTEDSVVAELSDDPFTATKTGWYFNIYATFGVAGIACLTVRSLCMAVHRLRASRTIHEGLTKSIMRAPVSYFDVTPTGRILNR